MDLQKLKLLMNPFPHLAGVYLMTGSEGQVLYVGKAKDLKKRVTSYLRAEGSKTTALLERVEALDYIITANEKEALILESSLIKKHRPRYNVDLRDDKQYPCLRLSLEDPFPRLQVVRKIKKDQALYFGPFSSAGKMREAVHYLHRVFPLRQCRQKELPRRSRPCLYFQTGKCPGPCHGKISPEEYGQRVQEVTCFLEGKNRELLKGLKNQMNKASEDLRFEEAVVLRDRIRAISETLKEQKVVSTRAVDLDAIAMVEQGESMSAVILFIRLGSVTGMTRFRFKTPAQSIEECLSDLIQQVYRQGKYIPRKILIPFPMKDSALIEEVLSELKGRKVKLQVPNRGEGHHWMRLAEENCQSLLSRKDPEQEYQEKIAQPLQERLGLKAPPLSVGAMDISNIQGNLAVGSWVVFTQGRPDKSGYRRFKIKTIDQPNDYAMMEEMILRLIRHYPKMPDLILVDGGKGQLNVLKNIIEKIPGARKPDILALAKKTFRAQGGKDGLYLPNRKNPIRLSSDSVLLHFLEKIRDEAHRFALAYHHKLREKEIRPVSSKGSRPSL
ncbi:MAG: excinuclease ABC subunit UvrC [Pseudomonadota bacterium]